MGDDTFNYMHQAHSLADYLLDEADEKLGWDIPEPDIKVPAHLLPPSSDDDENLLPSAAHPSYPYGTPYPSTHASTHGSPHSHKSPFPFPTHSRPTHSLSTTLPVLSLRHLFEITTFGDPKERSWNELGLEDLLDEGEREKEKEALARAGKSGETSTQPTGQNAGDHPTGEELEEMEEV